MFAHEFVGTGVPDGPLCRGAACCSRLFNVTKSHLSVCKANISPAQADFIAKRRFHIPQEYFIQKSTPYGVLLALFYHYKMPIMPRMIARVPAQAQ